MSRVFASLLRDAEARLAAFTTSEPPTAEPKLRALLDTSVVIGRLERCGRWCAAVASRSTLVARVAVWQSQWTRQHWTKQRWTTGMVLVTATVVHVLLAYWAGPQAGWLWFILPATSVSVGLLLMVAGRRGAARS